VGICFSIAGFNSFGVATTKYASAPQRSTIDTSRTLIIWIFFLIMPYPYREDFYYLQLLGFVLLVAGTLVYNEIVIIPWFGFDQNTKAAIEKRKHQKGYNGNDYIPTLSPGAPYDATRNSRALRNKMET